MFNEEIRPQGVFNYIVSCFLYLDLMFRSFLEDLKFYTIAVIFIGLMLIVLLAGLGFVYSSLRIYDNGEAKECNVTGCSKEDVQSRSGQITIEYISFDCTTRLADYSGFNCDGQVAKRKLIFESEKFDHVIVIPFNNRLGIIWGYYPWYTLIYLIGFICILFKFAIEALILFLDETEKLKSSPIN